MDPLEDRRRGERRRGTDRRRSPRGAPDRRRGDRRRAAAGAILAGVMLAAPEADAQIYTRRNEKGVLEATNAPGQAGFRLTYPGKGVVIHSRAWKLRPMYNGEFDSHIVDAAATHGVSVDLVRAVIQVESAYDHLAVSTKGARGLMQLMPDTARRLGVRDSFDPRQNVFGGVRYLRFLLDMFGGNVALAAAAYNAGENAVLKYGGIPPYRETRHYVEKVDTLLRAMNGAGAGTGAQEAARFFAPEPDALSRGSVARATQETSKVPALEKKKAPVYYRWKDQSGVLHVGHSPPAPGVSYTVIKGQD